MDALDAAPLFTLMRTWLKGHSHKTKRYKKKHANGQYNEEEVPIDTGEFGMEFTLDQNVQGFLDVQKILQYGNTEVFSQYAKYLGGELIDVWKDVVDKHYKYNSNSLPDLQTSANFHKALDKYVEAIANTENLRDMQLRYIRDPTKCFKLARTDPTEHQHRFNKMVTVSMKHF